MKRTSNLPEKVQIAFMQIEIIARQLRADFLPENKPQLFLLGTPSKTTADKRPFVKNVIKIQKITVASSVGKVKMRYYSIDNTFSCVY